MKKQRCSFTISIEIMFCLWTGVAFGQPFPEKPTARLGVGIIEKIAYSPDGKLLALAHNVIWLYDANNLTVVGVLQGQKGVVPSFAFSPDGKTIASAGDEGIGLWDVASQKSGGAIWGT